MGIGTRFFSWTKVWLKVAKGAAAASAGAAVAGGLDAVVPYLHDGGSVFSLRSLGTAMATGAVLGLVNLAQHGRKPKEPKL